MTLFERALLYSVVGVVMMHINTPPDGLSGFINGALGMGAALFGVWLLLKNAWQHLRSLRCD